MCDEEAKFLSDIGGSFVRTCSAHREGARMYVPFNDNGVMLVIGILERIYKTECAKRSRYTCDTCGERATHEQCGARISCEKHLLEGRSWLIDDTTSKTVAWDQAEFEHIITEALDKQLNTFVAHFEARHAELCEEAREDRDERRKLETKNLAETYVKLARELETLAKKPRER